MPSNPVTLSQVQAGLQTTILRVKKSNGYSYDLPDDHVYKVSQQQILQSKEIADYPKIIFTLDSGKGQKGASRSFDRSIRYGVTFILHEAFAEDTNNPPAGWRPVADELRELTGDVEKAVIADQTLGDLVDDVSPSEFETDSDTAYPEAILVYWFDITYRKQM